MTIKQNTAEGGTNGTAVTTANSGGASGDAFQAVTLSGTAWSATFSNTTPMHGSLCYALTTTDSTAAETAFLQWTQTASTAAAARVAARFTAAPVSAQFLSIRGSTVLARWQFSATGAIQLVNAAGGILYTAPAAVPLNTWVRVELYVKPGTGTTDGTITGAWYLGDSTTAEGSFTSTTVNAGTTQPTVMQVGRVATAGTLASFKLDDLAFTDAATGLIGPVPPSNVAPTVSAGPDQTNIEPWSPVTLTFSATDTDGAIASYNVTQASGVPVTLTAPTLNTRAYEAPGTIAGDTQTFSVTATDDDGAVSTPDTVSVTVLPVTERAADGGVEVPMWVRVT